MAQANDDREMLGATDDGDTAAEKEPMTAPQRSYLDTLAREAGEEIPADISKAEASEQIDRLQQETGRSPQ